MSNGHIHGEAITKTYLREQQPWIPFALRFMMPLVCGSITLIPKLNAGLR